MRLTKSQKRAVQHGGKNLQLIACAGSGKTEVVARRVVHLLTPGRKNSLSPPNIIAFTFTDKAAAELKERIVTRTREELDDLVGMADMFVGTIHAFCLELLKAESPRHLRHEVLNDVQQRLFIDRNSRLSGLTASTTLDGAPLRRYWDTPHYAKALSVLLESETIPRHLRRCSVADGLNSYRQLLDEKSYLDYSTILVEAAKLLSDDRGVRERLSKRIKYVIVDEYQDVNPIQEAIISSLHDLGAHVCAVGDDDQTIHQWRGSDVQNILTFKTRYPDVDQIPLEENFRSSEGIVETARPFIEQNSARLTKVMKSIGSQSYETGDVVALAFDSPDDEAAHIVASMRALRGVAFSEDNHARGLTWSDMAVLLRSVKATAEPMTNALRDAGIPYVVTGMKNLFGTAEAEASRQLFYFMADANGVSTSTLETAWMDARLGVDKKAIKNAIKQIVAAKRSLTEDDQKRWGQYSIQRVFLSFLDDAGIREEVIPGGRGETVFYNLGKFSQLISDFEAIYFQSDPVEKYSSFANFLQYQADEAYPEGWQENQYANPDAVRIMTVHQAKGMQWPVVFLPQLVRNRFPGKGPGGRNEWHLLPKRGVRGQARYEGSIEDERRLFYVAMTRSQKFLHMTWAPVHGNRLYQRPSDFWNDVLASKFVKRRKPDYSKRPQEKPEARKGVANVVFSFSDLKYYFECPYQFKLRILYGFNAPIHEALGYGKSLHDALAEVHSRAIRGDIAGQEEVPDLLTRHLHTPFAYPALRADLETSAEKVLRDYLDDNAAEFENLEFSEKQIEIRLADGVSVNGRIDLVRRRDTDEVTIVDLKSSDRAQAEEVTEVQLHTYALGYQDLTGRDADYVEIYELDEGNRKTRSVDDEFIDDVKKVVGEAAEALRTSSLNPAPTRTKCGTCDYLGMCSAGSKMIDKRKP